MWQRFLPWTRKQRVVTPTILQMEITECGAACLAMILGYHGCIVPLEELRIACGVSRDGVKASNLVLAAQQYGMIAKGYKQEPEQLHTLPLPFVVFWNFNHFVVVEGFGRNRVYLNDPAWGRRTVTDQEFSQSFTGVVLTFEPDSHFQRRGQPTRLLDSLRRGWELSRSWFVYVWLLSLMLVLPGLIIPALGRVFVDHYLVGGMQSWLWPLLAGMGITAILRGVLVWLQQSALLRLEMKLAISSSAQFFWHLLQLPISFFQQRYRGALAARVHVHDRIARLFSGDLASAWLQVSMFVFFFFLMGYYDLQLTLWCLLLTSMHGFLLGYLFRHHHDLNLRLLMQREKVTGATVGGLNHVEDWKAMGMESLLLHRWIGLQTRVLHTEQSMGLVAQNLYVIPTGLAFLNMVCVLLLGSWRVMEGHMSLGTLVAFQSLMASINEPLQRLLGLGRQWQEASGELVRVHDVLRYPVSPETVSVSSTSSDPATTSPESLSQVAGVTAGTITLQHVTFGYQPQSPPLLEDISLHIPPGQHLALVGTTGCGKSTLGRLVCGLYQPWSGEILIDQTPLLSIPRNVRNRSLGLVSQDIAWFAGTVRENLTLWNPSIPEVDLLQATKDACIHEDIIQRSGGYDAIVKEHGHNWSGGQLQRLELARALISHPSILVLDEATHALDPLVEQQITKHLRKRGCTCLWIAHRLNTILACDVVAVLEQGRIVRLCSPLEYRDGLHP